MHLLEKLKSQEVEEERVQTSVTKSRLCDVFFWGEKVVKKNAASWQI